MAATGPARARLHRAGEHCEQSLVQRFSVKYGTSSVLMSAIGCTLRVRHLRCWCNATSISCGRYQQLPTLVLSSSRSGDVQSTKGSMTWNKIAGVDSEGSVTAEQRMSRMHIHGCTRAGRSALTDLRSQPDSGHTQLHADTQRQQAPSTPHSRHTVSHTKERDRGSNDSTRHTHTSDSDLTPTTLLTSNPAIVVSLLHTAANCAAPLTRSVSVTVALHPLSVSPLSFHPLSPRSRWCDK